MAAISYLTTVLLNLVLLNRFTGVSSHSQMTVPQSTYPYACRLGRLEKVWSFWTTPGVGTCPGPCNLDRLKENPPRLNFYPPNKPAAIYGRGQHVNISYTRNNHPSNGFNRFTLVPIADAMNKRIHERNAFHFSCWGAQVVVATKAQTIKDKFDFSVTDADGRFHQQPPSYYRVTIVIPTCIPDGDYYLGFAWFGGLGGNVTSNKPEIKNAWSFFGDYWSCSFVKIRGGKQLTSSYKKVFNPDMPQYSNTMCWSAVNDLGICKREECLGIPAKFMKPKQFVNGDPPLLKTWMFMPLQR